MYYKVCKKIGNRYYSAMLEQISKYYLEYKLNKEIERKIGGIFVFENLKMALRFKNIFVRKNGVILKCTGNELENQPLYIPIEFDDDEIIKNFWENKDNNISLSEGFVNTKLLKSIIITKEVK